MSQSPFDALLAQLQEKLQETMAHLEAAAVEHQRLKDALAPFAKVAVEYEAAFVQQQKIYKDEGRTPPGWPDSHRVSVLLGDCRKAYLAVTAP